MSKLPEMTIPRLALYALLISSSVGHSQDRPDQSNVNLFTGGWVNGYVWYLHTAIQFDRNGECKLWYWSDDMGSKGPEFPVTGHWKWEGNQLKFEFENSGLSTIMTELHPYLSTKGVVLLRKDDYQRKLKGEGLPISDVFFNIPEFDPTAPFARAVGHPLNRENFVGEWVAMTSDMRRTYVIDLLDDGTGAITYAIWDTPAPTSQIINWNYDRNLGRIMGSTKDYSGHTNMFSVRVEVGELREFRPSLRRTDLTNMVFIKTDRLHSRIKGIQEMRVEILGVPGKMGSQSPQRPEGSQEKKN